MQNQIWVRTNLILAQIFGSSTFSAGRETTENLGSLSIRTDGKDLSVTKTDYEQICFGFLCYFTSIK